MSVHRIHVFISHSRTYSGHYETLAKWIFERRLRMGAATLRMHNYSAPRSHPVEGAAGDLQLRRAIYDKLQRSHVVVIPTGMYAHHSKWIGNELRGAAYYGKPVLAVNPWGQTRTPSVVRAVADLSVGWRSTSVIKGIWELYYRRP